LTLNFPSDVYVDVPDIIDISHMRSKGIQPGEELLPEGASGDNKAEPVHPVASEDIVSQLASMGFNYLHCQKAAISTSNTGVEEAMNWLLSHMDDPGQYTNRNVTYYFFVIMKG
jgi:ubiquitin carboxyl-terminal hydrolase 5/13